MFSYEFTINATTLSEAAKICRSLSQAILDGIPRRSGQSPSSSFSYKKIDTSDDQNKRVVVPPEQDRTPEENSLIEVLRLSRPEHGAFIENCLKSETRIIELAEAIRKNSSAAAAPYLWRETLRAATELVEGIGSAPDLDGLDGLDNHTADEHLLALDTEEEPGLIGVTNEPEPEPEPESSASAIPEAEAETETPVKTGIDSLKF